METPLAASGLRHVLEAAFEGAAQRLRQLDDEERLRSTTVDTALSAPEVVEHAVSARTRRRLRLDQQAFRPTCRSTRVRFPPPAPRSWQ
jgi:hypothetical protein